MLILYFSFPPPFLFYCMVLLISVQSNEYRPRSGNPGYLIGKPIVFSTSPSNASDGLVLESNGIQVPWALKASVSSASSSCPSSSTLSKSLWTMESLKYGYDISTGCSLALNR